MALSRGSRLLYDWLKEQNAGTIVSYENLMEVTGWSRTSLLTYIGKNKFAPFLTKVDGYKLKVVLNGSEVTEQYFDETFTQTAPRQIALAPGDRLEGQNGAYTLEEPIGEGAIGKVWMVRTQQQQRHAAKIMLPRTDLLLSSKMPDIRERFRREANYGKTIDHPNVVDYLDVGQTERNPFLIMELANRSVADSLKADGAIIEEDVAEIIGCCIDGLNHIHDKGHLHRDIKPANILEFAETFKLGDLGVVKWSDFDPIVTQAGAITRQSIQIGSWQYISHEQQESAHDAKPASDVYSLGVTWIELVAGRAPMPQAVGARQYQLPPLREGVAELIGRMCSYSADERPPLKDIKAVIQDIYGG